jgi:hypothetical protein
MAMNGGISDAHEVKGLAGVLLPAPERRFYDVFPKKDFLRTHLNGCYLTLARPLQFT